VSAKSAPHDGQDTVKTLRTIIWYKTESIIQSFKNSPSVACTARMTPTYIYIYTGFAVLEADSVWLIVCSIHPTECVSCNIVTISIIHATITQCHYVNGKSKCRSKNTYTYVYSSSIIMRPILSMRMSAKVTDWRTRLVYNEEECHAGMSLSGQ